MAKSITIKQLENTLAFSRGTQIVTFKSRTVPRMKKLGNPHYGNLIKIARRNAIINASYESVMNKRMSRLLAKLQSSEITPATQKQIDDLMGKLPFKAGPRPWGVRRKGTPFVDHTVNGEKRLYLETLILREFSADYFTLDGKPVPKGQLLGVIVEPPDRPVMLRDYQVTNLLAITNRGEEYTINGRKARVIARNTLTRR